MPIFWDVENVREGQRAWKTSGKRGIKVHVSRDFVHRFHSDSDVWNIEFGDWSGKIFWKVQDHSDVAGAKKRAITLMHKFERIFDGFVKLNRAAQEDAVYRFAREDEKGTLDGERALKIFPPPIVGLTGVGRIVVLNQLEGSEIWQRYLDHECERLKLPGWMV
jgi:hypothetical protein